MSTEVLRQFVPLNELTEENLHDIAEKTPIEQLAKGKTLFHKGDADNYSYYLLTGKVVLVGEEGHAPTAILGGSSPTRFPLDHHKPHHATAFADTDITYFRIDNDLLDILLTWDQNAGYMVSEIDDEEEEKDGDWMTMMLHSEIFHRIPPSNIQQVFMRMEALPVKTGERIITQDDDGDYYYFIKSGRAEVTHVTKSGKEIKLAELESGTGFGEEALISHNKRNANVTMLSDGVLMRMAKDDFVHLLTAPVLQSVDYSEGKALVASQKAVWLDVRLESEHKNAFIPGSINIPLYLLRIKARGLNKKLKFVVYCNTGRRSSSAAYLLSERGFDACYLEGGLRGLEKEQLADLKRGEE